MSGEWVSELVSQSASQKKWQVPKFPHFGTNVGPTNMCKASFSVCCMIFQKFSIKSHNLKALIILNHSWSPIFLLTYLYGENELLCRSVHPFRVFSWEKTPPLSSELICNETVLQNYPFIIFENKCDWKEFPPHGELNNITKHCESDVERQISIQGIHLSAFLELFLEKRRKL